MITSTINIAVAANANYIPHVGAMLHSLFVANQCESFSVYFLHRATLEREHIDRLNALCEKHGATLNSIAVNPTLLSGLPIKGRYVEEAWYRVFMAGLIPQVDRVLWLDADAIVLDSIRPLWDIDLEGALVAACPNAMLYSDRELVKELGIKDRRSYFNTGVLLMDLLSMRNCNLEDEMREAIKKNYEIIRFADQDVLNSVLHNRCKRLHLSWNLLTHSYINVPETKRVHGKVEFREAMRKPQVIHFTGNEIRKPWSYRCSHPYRDIYLYHRFKAGWGAPDYTDKSLRTYLSRKIPLRIREILSLAVRKKFAEMWSCIYPW